MIITVEIRCLEHLKWVISGPRSKHIWPSYLKTVNPCWDTRQWCVRVRGQPTATIRKRAEINGRHVSGVGHEGRDSPQQAYSCRFSTSNCGGFHILIQSSLWIWLGYVKLSLYSRCYVCLQGNRHWQQKRRMNENYKIGLRDSYPLLSKVKVVRLGVCTHIKYNIHYSLAK